MRIPVNVTFVAYATSTANGVGADAGVTIERHVTEDGMLREADEIARIVPPDGELDGEDDGLDFDAVEAALARIGWRPAGAWTRSGGQWAAEIERTET